MLEININQGLINKIIIPKLLKELKNFQLFFFRRLGFYNEIILTIILIFS